MKGIKNKNIIISDKSWGTHFLKNRELTRARVYFDSEKENYMEIDIRSDFIMVNFPHMKITTTYSNNYGSIWKRLFKFNFNEFKFLKVWNLVIEKLKRTEKNQKNEDPKKDIITADEIFKDDKK